jgi:hypothetical protein
MLFLTVFGLIVMVCVKYWRREVKFLLIWSFVILAVFSYILFKEGRYILLLGPPIIIIALTGIFCVSQWWGAIFGRPTGFIFFSVFGLVLGFHVLTAPLIEFPNIKGFKEASRFLEKVSPSGRYFYDGRYDGIFSFYVRSNDPKFERGVVLGDKILYSASFFRAVPTTDYAASSSDVIEILQKNCGCQWLVIEKRGRFEGIASAGHLREALGGPEFQHVKSFPIHAPQPTRIDIYRFVLPVTVPEKLELSFPTLGAGIKLKAIPITR